MQRTKLDSVQPPAAMRPRSYSVLCLDSVLSPAVTIERLTLRRVAPWVAPQGGVPGGGPAAVAAFRQLVIASDKVFVCQRQFTSWLPYQLHASGVGGVFSSGQGLSFRGLR